ncbi:hypothetical protein [Streptomyces sp. NRRL F-5123]|uniref:hypothetical protein n=1 Tax=Streptomyces sp. NRRL F-5123 TaxID=1463856 RepID=UPI00069427BC|nr:hypothetical protein [Streptomyces sp. NRRL F-5123]
MADPSPIEMSVSVEGIQALGRALSAEADGKQLRKELAANLRAALNPAADMAKSGIMSMRSDHGAGGGPGLRQAIAKKVKPEVKLGGRWTGARVKAKKTPNIRGFPNAPKRTQKIGGFRTKDWNGNWRVQVGKFDWFDRAMAGRNEVYKRAVHEAMEAMAQRIADRAGE